MAIATQLLRQNKDILEILNLEQLHDCVDHFLAMALHECLHLRGLTIDTAWITRHYRDTTLPELCNRLKWIFLPNGTVDDFIVCAMTDIPRITQRDAFDYTRPSVANPGSLWINNQVVSFSDALRIQEASGISSFRLDNVSESLVLPPGMQITRMYDNRGIRVKYATERTFATVVYLLSGKSVRLPAGPLEIHTHELSKYVVSALAEYENMIVSIHVFQTVPAEHMKIYLEFLDRCSSLDPDHIRIVGDRANS